MSKIICFGEIMGRFNPPGYGRFVQSEIFELSYGGGEANVAVSLALFGHNASYVTKLPKNELGQSAVNSLRRYGVDTSYIVRGGERIGLYFLEKGVSQRPSKVIYDRKHSAIADAAPNDFNWKEIFSGADWFHFTGITPALSDDCAEICLEACKEAKSRNVTISCDINYRKNLWSRDKAKEVMSRLMEYADICIGNEEDAADVFGIAAEDSDVAGGKINHEKYIDVARRLHKQFSLKKVAVTLRSSISASDNKWAAMLFDGENAVFSAEYLIHIADRVGGGDAFGAGLIHSLLTGESDKEAVEFATAASCLKHSIEHDFNLSTLDEVKNLLASGGSGRIQR